MKHLEGVMESNMDLKEALLHKAIMLAKDDGRTIEGYIEHLMSKEYKRVEAGKKRARASRDPVQDILLPPFIDRDLYKEYIDVRVAKKYPVTRRVQDRLINSLVTFYNNGMDTSEILRSSILKGWADVYAIKGVNNAGCGTVSKASIEQDLQFNDF